MRIRLPNSAASRSGNAMSAFAKGKRYENCNRTRIKAKIKIKINELAAQSYGS